MTPELRQEGASLGSHRLVLAAADHPAPGAGVEAGGAVGESDEGCDAVGIPGFQQRPPHLGMGLRPLDARRGGVELREKDALLLHERTREDLAVRADDRGVPARQPVVGAAVVVVAPR